MKDAIIDVPGILVGHAQDLKAVTGCTVVVCKKGAVTGVDCRGGAPGTRELAALNPENVVTKAHAVYLGGGSAFGLAGADGVMQFLEERKIGFDTRLAYVPIVPGAILYDLLIGNPSRRPDKEMGYNACLNMSDMNIEQGSIGAGTGATVGIAGGQSAVMKGGIGTASIVLGDLIVGAIVAVNCIGDVVDPDSGQVLAGAIAKDSKTFLHAKNIMTEHPPKETDFIKNTTIGVIATNARLTSAQAKRIAIMAHDGFARAIIPAHSQSDGDTLFCMSTGDVSASMDAIGIMAIDAVITSISRGITTAESLCGILSYSDLTARNSTGEVEV